MSLLTKLPSKKIVPIIEPDIPCYSQDIEQLKERVSSAYANLDNVVDPLLIDSWIYEINAAQLRYQFCLQQIKNAGTINN